MTSFYVLGEAMGEKPEPIHACTKALVKACKAYSGVELLGLRQESEAGGVTEYLVIEAGDGTVNGGNPGGIHRVETLAIAVNPRLHIPVTVHALRMDFPERSHLHGSDPGTPRILCLYDVDWSGVERIWTAERFLERMFWWLRESSELRLHREDQPLEQMFYASPFQLILPAMDPAQLAQGACKLRVVLTDTAEKITLRAVIDSDASSEKSGYRLLNIMVPPVEPTSVVMFPANLGELHDQLVEWGSELSQQLSDCVYEAATGGIQKFEKGERQGLLILVWVPRLRHSVVERTDVKGYMLEVNLFDLAASFEMLAPATAEGVFFPAVQIGGYTGQAWKEFGVRPVEVRGSLNAAFARDLSAVDSTTATFNGVLAGTGALGGMLADIWTRLAWGSWTFIDPDLLLPHNVVRHVANDEYVGFRKADVLQDMMQRVYPGEPAPKAISKGILADDARIHEAIEHADLLIDATTTLAAPRDLALRDQAPRVASVFLTPSGMANVIILEDSERLQRVDALEGQYYRAILSNPWGEDHLVNHLGDRWVGGGCRDVSFRMSNENIHIHAGLISRRLRKIVTSSEPKILISTLDDESGSVESREEQVHPVTSVKVGEWMVKYDSGLIEKIRSQRLSELPNETGGSILGITDLKSKTIVLVDTLPPPPDSESGPTHFIRGKEGQLDALKRVHHLTAGVVDYVGDWHSHPNGCSVNPSTDDEILFATLVKRMQVEGLPAMMLIVSDVDLGVYVI
ncbi:Mov34/MPN/PAD-1 family protein [Pseudomonas sp. MM213]|uniref:Mov34/MPN/PAD-1 family protein n=1 Tax=Pseudomonas sp. MM213 TaxID=2866807 RepID=UPI001CF51B5C|nr:Mov34/MPN/PAD-1 family protein [Pseudomonas sp. MM213]UCP11536.1 Mov34/MPN/PAD-1 family protein [Pseudomonas sp. MM213]